MCYSADFQGFPTQDDRSSHASLLWKLSVTSLYASFVLLLICRARQCALARSLVMSTLMHARPPADKHPLSLRAFPRNCGVKRRLSAACQIFSLQFFFFFFWGGGGLLSSLLHAHVSRYICGNSEQQPGDWWQRWRRRPGGDGAQPCARRGRVAL